jgi:hypothetical protein
MFGGSFSPFPRRNMFRKIRDSFLVPESRFVTSAREATHFADSRSPAPLERPLVRCLWIFRRYRQKTFLELISNPKKSLLRALTSILSPGAVTQLRKRGARPGLSKPGRSIERYGKGGRKATGEGEVG